METGQAVWGIDPGAAALKALKLREVDAGAEIEEFRILEYALPSGPTDEDRTQRVRDALRRLRADADLTACRVVASLPGPAGCVRFVHLPPVDESEVPNVIRFEAAQQLPWPVDEVIWHWQTFRDLDELDSPEVDAGIFAARRDEVGRTLLLLAEAGVTLDAIQLAPLALYNFLRFDERAAAAGATLLVDVGAETTDLILADERRIWTRTLPAGGGRFTEAVAEKLHLPLEEAERLKCSASAGGERADGVRLAVRPACEGLADSVRQALDEYAEEHRPCRPAEVLLTGGAARQDGLADQLERSLGAAVRRLDGFRKAGLSLKVQVQAVADGAASLAVAFGLALQGLGPTAVHTNFLPAGVARRRTWPTIRQGLLAWLREHFPGLGS
jgi:type IV pilus assembly protein PilM